MKRSKSIPFFAAGCDGPLPTRYRGMGHARRNDSRLTVADVNEPTGVIPDLVQHVPLGVADLRAHDEMSVEEPSVHLFKGKAATVIQDAAEGLDVDLIVMGSVGRTGILGFFIGNTDEAVRQSVQTSVLAVEPKGFQSPVS